MIRRTAIRVVILAGLGVAIATPGFPHPTDQELREASEDRERCASPRPVQERVDPVALGMSGDELARAVTGLRADPKSEASLARSKLGLRRFTRVASGDDLAEVEYELWQDRIYRIRWKLAPRFERPLVDAFASRARGCLGRPDYDQKIEAEPGSPHATLRRVGWTHGERRVELRQLHPLRGGALYLTVSDYPTLREIVSSRAALYPEPEKSAPWWERSMKPPEPATQEERKELEAAFALLLSQLDH